MKTHLITVRELGDDPRLDKVIPLHVESLSRSLVRKLIENGSVYVNQKRCSKNARSMRVGDKIKIVVAAETREHSYELNAEQIIYEDADIIVLNKPPFLPTHATLDAKRHHLAESVQIYLGKKSGRDPKNVYLGMHHRLDRDTSGVILFTKRKELNAPIAQAFQGRDLEKTYLAVSKGKPQQETFIIKNYLGPNPRDKKLMCSVTREGKFAETHFRALHTLQKENESITLFEAQPKTGRTHQIRVHLSEAGYPILGDSYYGTSFPGVERMLLHAWKLKILDKTFLAPLPRDFLKLDFQEPQA